MVTKRFIFTITQDRVYHENKITKNQRIRGYPSLDMAFKRKTYKYFGHYYRIFMVYDYDCDV